MANIDWKRCNHKATLYGWQSFDGTIMIKMIHRQRAEGIAQTHQGTSYEHISHAMDQNGNISLWAGEESLTTFKQQMRQSKWWNLASTRCAQAPPQKQLRTDSEIMLHCDYPHVKIVGNATRTSLVSEGVWWDYHAPGTHLHELGSHRHRICTIQMCSGWRGGG